MKLVLCFGLLLTLGALAADDAPGFFLKVNKNVPRVRLRLISLKLKIVKALEFYQLGKRNNFFIKQGGKNVPRLGRRSGYQSNTVEELKYYNHVQPFDSKFMVDFLSDELFSNGDLKFISWNDFDKALESDVELKKKLTSIARDKEIDELKKLINNSSDDNEVYGRPIMYTDANNKKVYQKFIPYDSNGNGNFKYNNMENEVYYYQHHDDKRDGAGQA